MVRSLERSGALLCVPPHPKAEPPTSVVLSMGWLRKQLARVWREGEGVAQADPPEGGMVDTGGGERRGLLSEQAVHAQCMRSACAV